MTKAQSPAERIRPRDRDAIIQSLRAGVVPRGGQRHIQVGRANEVAALVADIDRIADGGSAIRFDEGFGTLDPETLEDVVDALERLREGDLLVGVISHVPLLSERIRAGLTVEKAGGWSTIKAAHE